MKPLNQASCRVLDVLTEGLADPSGDGVSSRRYDNGGPGTMPASVQRLGPNRYSLAHYFEQNGDLVPDPDLELVRHQGRWYPAAITHGPPFGRYVVAMTTDEAGKPHRVWPAIYKALRSFATLLVRNVKHQQGIKVPSSQRSGGKPPTPDAITFEGEDLGTVEIHGRTFTVEKRGPQHSVDMDRPVYLLRGARGSAYRTCRNRRNPEHLFLLNMRNMGTMDAWLTDANGRLEVLR